MDYKKFGKLGSYYLNDLKYISEEQAESIIQPLVDILYKINIQMPNLLFQEVTSKAIHILEDEDCYELIFIREICKKSILFKFIRGKKYRQIYLILDIKKQAGFFKGIENIEINGKTNFFQHTERLVKFISADNHNCDKTKFTPRFNVSAVNNEMAKDILLCCLRAGNFSNELIESYSTLNEFFAP
jgi:hypothetical protein